MKLATRGMASDEMSEQRLINRASNTPAALIAALLACSMLAFPSVILAADPTTGWASTWNGPGAATRDCVFPWKDCAPRRVTSLDTGISIIVKPQMFCLCHVDGVAHPDRLIDLGPAEVAALGLPGPGLWRVSVELLTQCPIGISVQSCKVWLRTGTALVPDTSTLPSQKGSR